MSVRVRLCFITGLFSFIILCSSDYVFSQANHFANHKTGTFIYKNSKDRKDYIIKRTKTRQYEINKNKNTKLIFKVNWIDEQNFQLVFLKSKNYMKTGCLVKGFTIDVKILEAMKDTYKWEANNDECGGKKTGEFQKIK